MKEQKIDLKEMNKDNNQGKIVIYQTDDGDTKIDVRFVDETVWLTQAQLCELYQTSKSNVSEHIKIFLKRASLKKIQLFGNSEQLRVTVKIIAFHIIISI